MLKRTPFRPKAPPRREAKQIDYTPTPRAVAVAIHDGKARMVVPLPKDAPLRDQNYLRRVAALPCAHCGRPGPSQAAHSDAGKGLAIKAGDDTAFPLCADGPGRRGCHTLIGATGMFSREQRRHLEQTYAARTRAILSPTTTKEPTWPEADTQTGCS